MPPRRNDDFCSGSSSVRMPSLFAPIGSAAAFMSLGSVARTAKRFVMQGAPYPQRFAQLIHLRIVGIVAFVRGRGIQPYKHAVIAVSPTSPESIAYVRHREKAARARRLPKSCHRKHFTTSLEGLQRPCTPTTDPWHGKFGTMRIGDVLSLESQSRQSSIR
jgi:hypothetical protein